MTCTFPSWRTASGRSSRRTTTRSPPSPPPSPMSSTVSPSGSRPGSPSAFSSYRKSGWTRWRTPSAPVGGVRGGSRWRRGGGGRWTGPWRGWSRRSGPTRRAGSGCWPSAWAGSPYGPIRARTTPGGNSRPPGGRTPSRPPPRRSGSPSRPGPPSPSTRTAPRTRSGSGSRRPLCRIWNGPCGPSPGSRPAVPTTEPAGQGHREPDGHEQPGDRAQGGGQGVVDGAHGRAVHRVGQIGEGEPAAHGDGETQQCAAECRAEGRRGEGTAAAGGDRDPGDGEDGGRDGQPETGDFEHVVTLPETVDLGGREHGDLGGGQGDPVLHPGGDRGDVHGHLVVAAVPDGPQHGLVDGSVALVPRGAEGRGPGEGAHQGPYRRVDFALHRVRDTVPHGGVGGERCHRRDVPARVGEAVRRPGRHRAEGHEQTGQGDQGGRQGAADTRGHPSRQDDGGRPREPWSRRFRPPVEGSPERVSHGSGEIRGGSGGYPGRRRPIHAHPYGPADPGRGHAHRRHAHRHGGGRLRGGSPAHVRRRPWARRSGPGHHRLPHPG